MEIKKWSDVTITCVDGVIKAHKCIISNACEYFDRAFSSGMEESQTNNVILNAKIKYAWNICIHNVLISKPSILRHQVRQTKPMRILLMKVTRQT